VSVVGKWEEENIGLSFLQRNFNYLLIFLFLSYSLRVLGWIIIVQKLNSHRQDNGN
jgi:hypothetical protein